MAQAKAFFRRSGPRSGRLGRDFGSCVTRKRWHQRGAPPFRQTPIQFCYRLALFFGRREKAGTLQLRGHFSQQRNGGFSVRNETCEISSADAMGDPARFVIKEGQITTNVGVTLPRPASDRLFLVNASNVPEFRPVYDALTNMAFYSLAPDVMRWPQPSDSGELLGQNGQNLASVLAALERRNSPRFDRIQRYLSKVTPGVEGVERIAIGNLETLQFRQKVAGQKSAWKFPAINMSDGTLRALAVLTFAGRR